MFQPIAARAFAFVKRLARAERRRAARARVLAVKRQIEAGGALEERVAVITGASSGIGLAIATAFARAGAWCIMVAIDREAGEAAQSSLEAHDLHVELHVTDIADDAQVRALAYEVSQRHPRVDVLVNNAGVFFEDDRHTLASGVTDAQVERTLAVNLYGTIHVSRALAPLMQDGGRILNVSSAMGHMGLGADGYSSAYRLSKAALNSYTKSLAEDLNPRGIMVDCFHPGWVKTALGGPDAQIEPKDAVDTAFYLATRPAGSPTGLFWWDCEVIEW